MVSQLAQLVSFIFHPLLMPTALFALIFFFIPRLTRPFGEANLLLIFIITCCIPLISVLALRFAYLILIFKMWRLKLAQPLNNQQALLRLRDNISMVNNGSLISSYNMEIRKERILPFVLITLYYGVITLLMAYKTPFPPIFAMIMLVVTVISLAVTIITVFWKVSVHSAAVSAVFGFTLGVIYTGYQIELIGILCLVSLVVGLVMSARLFLNVHSPAQVWVGAAIGIMISFTSVYFYL